MLSDIPCLFDISPHRNTHFNRNDLYPIVDFGDVFLWWIKQFRKSILTLN